MKQSLSFNNLLAVFKLIWKYNHSYLYILSILALGLGALPYVSLTVTQRILNIIQFDFANRGKIIAAMIFYFVVLSINIIATNLYNYLLQRYSDYLQKELNLLFMQVTQELALDDFEDSKTYDILSRAEKQIGIQPIALVNNILSFLTNFIGFIYALIILVSWHLWPLVGFIVLPVIAYNYFLKVNYLEYNTITKRSNQERLTWYLSYLLTKDYHIKEVKSFNLFSHLYDRFKLVKENIYKENQLIHFNKSKFYLFYQFGNLLFAFLIVAVAIEEANTGAILIGSLVMYINTATRIEKNITILTKILFEISKISLYCSHINDFFNLAYNKKEMKSKSLTIIPPPNQIDEIIIRGLSFSYNKGKKESLKEINAIFNKGKIYAIVGENGSGKSTLIKVLSGLYSSYQGEILFNKINSRQLDFNYIRQKIAACFQDFNKYEFTVKENISLGDIDEQNNDIKIEDAAMQSEASTFIQKLPNKFNQQLGNWFSGGIQLSGGQWQKIAISRTLFKNSDIYLFDECTSALDPISEYQFYENLKKNKKEKIIIYITHRLINTRIADEILYMKNGKIEERGSFETLMSSNTEFSKLYNLQQRSDK